MNNETIDFLLQNNFFTEFKLNKNVENELLILQKKIKHALGQARLIDLKLEKFGSEFSFNKEKSKYFDESIQDDIINNYMDGIKLTFSNGQINVEIKFYRMKNNAVTDESILVYARLMLSWILVIKEYESDNCVKNLTVDVYLTKNKKRLPDIVNRVIGAKMLIPHILIVVCMARPV